jgi:hypothetical protein
MVGIDVADSLSDLTARHPSVKVKHLGTNLLHNISSRLNIHELVVKGVTSTYNFNIIHVVGINGGEGNATVVNLAIETFISEEIVSKNTTVRVRTIQALLTSDIREVS